MQADQNNGNGAGAALLQHNTFHFVHWKVMHAYLGGIIPSRRNAIRDIQLILRCEFEFSYNSIFAVLSNCESLQHLTIDLSFYCHHFALSQHDDMTELKQLRGLQSLKLIYDSYAMQNNNFVRSVCQARRISPITPQEEDKIRFEVAHLEEAINYIVTSGTKEQRSITQLEGDRIFSRAGVNPRSEVPSPDTAFPLQYGPIIDHHTLSRLYTMLPPDLREWLDTNLRAACNS